MTQTLVGCSPLGLSHFCERTYGMISKQGLPVGSKADIVRRNSPYCHNPLNFMTINNDNNSTTRGSAAQLSRRDRATLCVIEYFAKSLKVIRNDTVE